MTALYIILATIAGGIAGFVAGSLVRAARSSIPSELPEKFFGDWPDLRGLFHERNDTDERN